MRVVGSGRDSPGQALPAISATCHGRRPAPGRVYRWWWHWWTPGIVGDGGGGGDGRTDVQVRPAEADRRGMVRGVVPDGQRPGARCRTARQRPYGTRFGEPGPEQGCLVVEQDDPAARCRQPDLREAGTQVPDVEPGGPVAGGCTLTGGGGRRISGTNPAAPSYGTA